MLEIKVYNDIENKDAQIFFSLFGLECEVFSADKVKNIFADNKNENDFLFSFHCRGGEVSEGLAIYDIIRNSGKNIYCNIDGGCHSMAVVLLLAAPKENRTANRNARALIHRVQGFVPDYANADELRDYADQIEQEENAILDIYEERTSSDRNTLQDLMHAEKQLTAQQLLDYGFISKINSYNTNLIKSHNRMSKGKNLIERVSDFRNAFKNLLGVTKNYDFTDDNGNLLFSTEQDDDTLAVGMAATPDGTFELPDGRTVTIADGAITDITEPSPNNQEVEDLTNLLNEANEIIEAQQDEIKNLKAQITSNKQMQNRVVSPNKKMQNGGAKTVAELKNEIKEKGQLKK
ncbi:MAG: ATP-dependent Clp protease proteolytic subunit [Paludibacter sp.]|nr:ATP-dependent Clp protease proteolytic subunit [Paludibacter sp.]